MFKAKCLMYSREPLQLGETKQEILQLNYCTLYYQLENCDYFEISINDFLKRCYIDKQ